MRPVPQQQPQAPSNLAPQALAPVTTQPSFDCTKARGQDELAVCANAELSALDRALSQVYYALADALPNDARMQLRVAQGQWLSQRRVCDGNAACIAQAYRSRIAQLQPGDRQASAAPVAGRTVMPQVKPSFDCAKARKPDEKAVCADAVLAAKDIRLSEAFGRYRARLTPDAQKQLMSAQAVWLAQRGQCQSDVPCVGRAYDQRTREIEALLAR